MAASTAGGRSRDEETDRVRLTSKPQFPLEKTDTTMARGFGSWWIKDGIDARRIEAQGFASVLNLLSEFDWTEDHGDSNVLQKDFVETASYTQKTENVDAIASLVCISRYLPPADCSRGPRLGVAAGEACPSGGTGRRAAFRMLWPKGRGGSSPLFGTKSHSRSLPAPAADRLLNLASSRARQNSVTSYSTTTR